MFILDELERIEPAPEGRIDPVSSKGVSYESFLDNFKLDRSYNDWRVATYIKNVLTFKPYKNYEGYSQRKLGCCRQCMVKPNK